MFENLFCVVEGDLNDQKPPKRGLGPFKKQVGLARLWWWVWKNWPVK